MDATNLGMILARAAASSVGGFLLAWITHEWLLRDRLSRARASGQFRGFWHAHPPAFLPSYLLLFMGYAGVLQLPFLALGPTVSGMVDWSSILVSVVMNLVIWGVVIVVGLLALAERAKQVWRPGAQPGKT